MDKKHNYFDITGAIVTKEKMTTEEFVALLEEKGFELLGSVSYSKISDEDYE